jgi:hypothetical protein
VVGGENIIISLARIGFSDGFPRLFLIDFGNRDVSMFKDAHGIIHLEYVDGKLVIQDQPREVVINGEISC